MRKLPTSGFTLVEIMVVVVVIGLLATMAIPAFQKIKQKSQDNTVLNNARQLAAAADQYFLETGVTTVASSDLIGPTQYIRFQQPVGNEVYPAVLTQGVTLTVTGVGGVRTITFSP
ncbi:MAG TPA: prepilin-type N-terminal cleavage/methylation domain-containing protein [Candidatus Didemnitutus sp.]|nr:prepilin-type N-terminal cleavage/methylation domain-containing protein [Candidatus Didemnitutus sp.]